MDIPHFDALALATTLLRLTVGGFMIPHGLQKFGLLGSTRAEQSAVFASWGMRPGTRWSVIGGIVQVGLGALLIAGLLTPLAALGLIVFMMIAVAVELRRHGWYWNNHGMEYAIFWSLTAAGVGLLGPGPWSLDHVLGI